MAHVRHPHPSSVGQTDVVRCCHSDSCASQFDSGSGRKPLKSDSISGSRFRIIPASLWNFYFEPNCAEWISYAFRH